jgi:hypothetical protein
MTLEVTAIVEAQSRRNAHVDEFVTALAAALGSRVPVIEGTLANSPPTGYLIAFNTFDLEDYPALGHRIVLMNTNGATIADDLEQFKLVAAVDRQRYFRWVSNRNGDQGRGVVGRKELAEACDAIVSGVYESTHYGTLASGRYCTLPSLLAAYLRAHAGELEPAPPPPAGARTIGRGWIVIGDPLDVGRATGVYRGHVAGRPDERRLITLGCGHDESHATMRARLAFPVAGVTPLELVANVDAPDSTTWVNDALVEVEPAGVPVGSLAPLSEPAAIRVAIATARILATAHAAGHVLGGVRPGAIYVTGDRNHPEVTALAPRGTEFLDTGKRSGGMQALATVYERESLTHKEKIAATDVFALCATTFELVAGAHPFGPLGAQLGGLIAYRMIPWPGSPELGAVLQRGLAREPSDRFTAAELADALTPLLDHPGTPITHR